MSGIDRRPARIQPSGLVDPRGLPIYDSKPRAPRNTQDGVASRTETISTLDDPFLRQARERVNPNEFRDLDEYRAALAQATKAAELAHEQSQFNQAKRRKELIYQGRRALSNIPFWEGTPTDEQALEEGRRIERESDRSGW